MAELSLAASIVGLVSLGIQISQGLNLYIDSASNAKPRVQAITTDIELAIQVVSELKSTIEDPVSKTLINDSSQHIAAKTILQFRRVFDQIKLKIPTSGQTGIRAYQRLKWPFTESKVNLLRAELENAKATLQLLMDVIILAAMRKSYADAALLGQREQRAQESKRRQKKTMAAVKIAALEHDQTGSQIQRPDSIDDRDSDGLHDEGLLSSSHSSDSFGDDRSSGGQDSVFSGPSSEYDDLVESLLSDYEICLGRLKAMQIILKGAIRKLGSTSAERSTGIARRRMVKEVYENGQQTVLHLEKHVVKSVSHRRIMRKGYYSARHKSAGTRTSRPLHSHEVIQPGADNEEFEDVLEYQSDADERDNPHDDEEQPSERENVTSDDKETKAKRAKILADATTNRKSINGVSDLKRRYEEEVAASKARFELELERHAATHDAAEVEGDADREHEFQRKRFLDSRAAAEAEAASSLRLERQTHQSQERERRDDDSYLRLAQEKEKGIAYLEELRKQKQNEGQMEWENQEFLREQEERNAADEAAKKEEQTRIDLAMRARLDKLGYSRHEIDQILSSETVLPGESQIPLHNRRSRSQGRSNNLSGKSIREQREEAKNKARRLRDEETAALKLRLELQRSREEPNAAEAELVREQEANASIARREFESLKHQRKDSVVAKARRRHSLKAVSPEIELPDDSRERHASKKPTRSKKERQRSRKLKSKVGTIYDNSDSTTDDDIEGLVREWTNLYDQGPTTVRGAAAEPDSGIQGAYDTYRYIQPPRPAGMTSRRLPVYVEVQPSSHTSSGSIGSGRGAIGRHRISFLSNDSNLETHVTYVD